MFFFSSSIHVRRWQETMASRLFDPSISGFLTQLPASIYYYFCSTAAVPTQLFSMHAIPFELFHAGPQCACFENNLLFSFLAYFNRYGLIQKHLNDSTNLFMIYSSCFTFNSWLRFSHVRLSFFLLSLFLFLFFFFSADVEHSPCDASSLLFSFSWFHPFPLSLHEQQIPGKLPFNGSCSLLIFPSLF